MLRSGSAEEADSARPGTDGSGCAIGEETRPGRVDRADRPAQ